MTLQETLAALMRFEDVAVMLPSDFAGEPPAFFEGYSEEEIARFERDYKLVLPNDYRDFSRECGGFIAMDFWNGYLVFSLDEARYRLDSSAEPNFQWLVIEGHPIHVLPIGGDGGGNRFFLTVGKTSEVWKLDHEVMGEFRSDFPDALEAEIQSPAFEPDSIEKISDSFLEFLVRVLKDWEAFAAGNSDWKYISG